MYFLIIDTNATNLQQYDLKNDNYFPSKCF